MTPQRPLYVRVDLERIPTAQWGRALQEAAETPPGAAITLAVPTNALVPPELDELRHAHGPRVAVTAPDWLTSDRWRTALREGVTQWLGMTRP